jgi:hypothetical protein
LMGGLLLARDDSVLVSEVRGRGQEPRESLGLWEEMDC